jgi:YidC/Oxa1 family membrane protein insertase
MSQIWNLLILDPMINLLLWIYSLIGNFGVAIIIFTILIKLVTFPLTAKQLKSSQAMAELQKSSEWQEIQKKYKDNREKLAQEQMRIYQEKGISPFGSCLPLIIQFPVIIGLYQAVIRALSVTPVQLLDLSKHVYPLTNVANLIPINKEFLWMDLTQPERLVIFGLPIPLLTILVVVTTYLQQKLMVMPSTGSNDQSAQMSKMMNLYMPFLMGWIAYTLNAGLALYFVVTNLVGIIQYAAMGKLNLDWFKRTFNLRRLQASTTTSPSVSTKGPVSPTQQANKTAKQKKKSSR